MHPRGYTSRSTAFRSTNRAVHASSLTARREQPLKPPVMACNGRFHPTSHKYPCTDKRRLTAHYRTPKAHSGQHDAREPTLGHKRKYAAFLNPSFKVERIPISGEQHPNGRNNGESRPNGTTRPKNEPGRTRSHRAKPAYPISPLIPGTAHTPANQSLSAFPNARFRGLRHAAEVAQTCAHGRFCVHFKSRSSKRVSFRVFPYAPKSSYAS